MRKEETVPVTTCKDTVLVSGKNISIAHRCSSIERKIDFFKGSKELQIKPRDFRKTELQDSIELDVCDSVWCGLSDYAAYCLARYLMGDSVNMVFHDAILDGCNRGFSHWVERLAQDIDGLGGTAVESAIRLAAFDPRIRFQLKTDVATSSLNIDQDTIFNVQQMAKRFLHFHEVVGDRTAVDLDFTGGYTQSIETGTCEFITGDTLWCLHQNYAVDSKLHISRADKLRVLTHWRMGLRSIHPEFKEIKKLGVYNVRRHLIYVMDIDKVSDEVVTWIDNVVIGYEMQ